MHSSAILMMDFVAVTCAHGVALSQSTPTTFFLVAVCKVESKELALELELVHMHIYEYVYIYV